MLESSINERDTRISDLNRRNSQTEQQNRNLRALNQSFQQRYDELQQSTILRLSEYESQLNSLRQQQYHSAELERIVNIKESKINEQLSRISQLQRQALNNESLQSKISELENNLHLKNSRTNELEITISRLNVQLSNISRAENQLNEKDSIIRQRDS